MAELRFGDRGDFEDADRGFIARLDPGIVRSGDGRVVWDGDAYGFLSGDCPDTANPSLWRQSQLCARQGLYGVTEGVYQVRGLDLSNMTLVEGDQGVIVIDPLISAETAAAALGLYRSHRGERPVTAVIYTHSPVDHFGGVQGVVAEGVPILAPVGFLEHAVSENVCAGNAMNRRAVYMYGAVLERGPAGQLGAGLGLTNSTGSIGLLPPTIDITRTGQQETLGGVRLVFQLTPGTKAPAERNFLLPDQRALCLAENATHNLHNLLTLRGALVRDPPQLVAVPDRGDQPVRRPGRGRLRLPPLAHLGPRPDREVPLPATRPVRLPGRPDAAAAQCRPHRHRDRRAAPAAVRPGGRLAHPRLLRLGQPQRQGHLPAVPGLVRRQPGLAVGTPAGRGCSTRSPSASTAPRRGQKS